MSYGSRNGKASEADLQPEDGYINPMGRIGVVRPTTYSLGNQLDGYYISQHQ